MSILAKLWNDERGAVVSTELILLGTIIVIGLIVGLVAWRDSLVQEFGDTGASVGQFNQSYAVEVQANPGAGITVDNTTNEVTITRTYGDVTTRGSFNNFEYVDQSDIGDGQDQANMPPAGIQMGIPPINEGDPLQ